MKTHGMSGKSWSVQDVMKLIHYGAAFSSGIPEAVYQQHHSLSASTRKNVEEVREEMMQYGVEATWRKYSGTQVSTWNFALAMVSTPNYMNTLHKYAQDFERFGSNINVFVDNENIGEKSATFENLFYNKFSHEDHHLDVMVIFLLSVLYILDEMSDFSDSNISRHEKNSMFSLCKNSEQIRYNKISLTTSFEIFFEIEQEIFQKAVEIFTKETKTTHFLFVRKNDQIFNRMVFQPEKSTVVKVLRNKTHEVIENLSHTESFATSHEKNFLKNSIMTNDNVIDNVLTPETFANVRTAMDAENFSKFLTPEKCNTWLRHNIVVVDLHKMKVHDGKENFLSGFLFEKNISTIPENLLDTSYMTSTEKEDFMHDSTNHLMYALVSELPRNKEEGNDDKDKNNNNNNNKINSTVDDNIHSKDIAIVKNHFGKNVFLTTSDYLYGKLGGFEKIVNFMEFSEQFLQDMKKTINTATVIKIMEEKDQKENLDMFLNNKFVHDLTMNSSKIEYVYFLQKFHTAKTMQQISEIEENLSHGNNLLGDKNTTKETIHNPYDRPTHDFTEKELLARKFYLTDKSNLFNGVLTQAQTFALNRKSQNNFNVPYIDIDIHEICETLNTSHIRKFRSNEFFFKNLVQYLEEFVEFNTFLHGCINLLPSMEDIEQEFTTAKEEVKKRYSMVDETLTFSGNSLFNIYGKPGSGKTISVGNSTQQQFFIDYFQTNENIQYPSFVKNMKTWSHNFVKKNLL